MRRIRQLRDDNSGSVLIFVSVVIFLLAAFTWFAIDISKLLVARAQLQNSADAGALAGAERFLEEPVPGQSEIEARAVAVAAMNVAFTSDNQNPVANVDPELVEATAVTEPGDDYGTVTVISSSIVAQYFTGLVVGPTREANVRALAAAKAGEICRQNCLKPWTIPDLWDDQTSIPGWPQWRNNNKYDYELFIDVNQDGLWNPGEPFTDGVDAHLSGPRAVGGLDGQWTSEYYHPVQTGYTASRNLGDQVTLKADGNASRPEPGQYFPVVLGDPEDTNERGADRYRWNIANCNPNAFGPGDWLYLEPGMQQGPTIQGMRDLIAKDPDAFFDEGCDCIKDSEFPISPRIIFIPIHDPRIPITPGRNAVQIVKIAAFFVEEVRGRGEVTGRFVRVQSPGQFCDAGEGGGGFVYNISLIR